MTSLALGSTEPSMRSRGGAQQAAGTSNGHGGSAWGSQPPPRGASLHDDGDDHRRKAAQMGLTGGNGYAPTDADRSAAAAVNFGPLGFLGDGEGRVLLAIVALALVVRLWKIGQPSSVV